MKKTVMFLAIYSVFFAFSVANATEYKIYSNQTLLIEGEMPSWVGVDINQIDVFQSFWDFTTGDQRFFMVVQAGKLTKYNASSVKLFISNPNYGVIDGSIPKDDLMVVDVPNRRVLIIYAVWKKGDHDPIFTIPAGATKYQVRMDLVNGAYMVP